MTRPKKPHPLARLNPVCNMTATEFMRELATERQIQEGILALLWGAGIPAFHIPNRGLMDKATGRYNHVDAFFVPGVPDIAAPLSNGRTLWIEVKAAKGVVSDAQAAYHAKLRSKGHLVVVARSVAVVYEDLVDLGIILA